MDELFMCYNKACGQKFTFASNLEDSCRYHPGTPVFHDALKGWSCCSKRTTDFSDFLNIPGCKIGKHNHEKPKELIKDEVINTKVDKKELIPQLPSSQPQNQPLPIESSRPSINQSKVDLPIKTTSSYNQSKVDQILLNKETTNKVEIGTICKHKACNESYTGTSDDDSTCIYHPGSAIFHEGMKYWSCCERKTSDFNSFLSQQGCTKGKHVWKEDIKLDVECRCDWHQTGNLVNFTIFAKNANAKFCNFSANSVSFDAEVYFEGGKRFSISFHLEQDINCSESKVSISATKIEVLLRKARLTHWKKIGSLINKKNEDTEEKETEDEDEDQKELVIDSDDDLSGIEDVEFD